MNELLQQIHRIGVVPVIKITDPETAVPLARALDKGGIPVAEVTFRTQHAAEAIRRISAEVPQVLTGAGTVTTTEQVDTAVAAGAKFIVTPGFNPKVVDYCLKRNIPILPGASGPSEIEQAMERGLEVVKCFPAEALGGLPYIKALSGPYTEMKFMPTGGVNPGNITSYLGFSKILACGGSWMIDAKLIAAGDYEGIAQLCRQAVDVVLGLEFSHVGINNDGDAEAQRTAAALAPLLGAPTGENPNAMWSSSSVEVMKSQWKGTKGHLAISCSNLDRAVFQLERRGLVFDPDSAGTSADGKRRYLFLKDEIGGFAVQIIER